MRSRGRRRWRGKLRGREVRLVPDPIEKLAAAFRMANGGRLHLGELTSVLAARYPGRVLIEAADGAEGPLGRSAWTAEALDADAVRLAGRFVAQGLGNGQVVLVALDNRPDLLVVLLALWRAGAVPAPVNPHLTDEEILGVRDAVGAQAAVVDAAGAVRMRWVVDRVVPVEGDDDVDASALVFDARDPGDTAVLLTTSGTTGRPKAAALTSRALLAPFAPLALVPVGRTRGARAHRDKVLSGLPLPHVMGLATALGALCAGVPLAHMARFRAPDVLDAIERLRPNVFVGVPTMYADLEDAGAAERDLSSMQLWVSGADRMPEDRARRFQSYGSAVTVGGRPVGRAAFLDVYGMVELSGPAASRVFLPSAGGLRLRTPYRVLPGFSVRATDGDGAPVRAGRVGELWFRGTGVFVGYRGHDAGPDEQGWFRSGDHGRVFGGGLFVFAGRERDRLKVGGFSVFPAEVEAALAGHPDVVEVALVGVPDDRLGERPVAVVVAREGFDVDGFVAWARERVAGYRRPREVLRVASLPRGPNGKLDRAAATRLAVGNRGEDR